MAKRRSIQKKSRAPRPGTGSRKIKPPTAEELNKALAPIREARDAREALAVTVRPTIPPLSPDTVKSVLASMGLKLGELEKMAATHRKELRALADERVRAAAGRSKSLQAFLDRQIAERRKAAQGLSELLPNTRYTVLDRPNGILTTGGLQLDHGRIQSYASWGKVRHQSASYDPTVRTLVFSYFWQNAIGADAVITADGYIVLNGVAQAIDAGGLWLFSHSHTTLTLSVQLSILDWPVTSQGSEIGYDETALYLDAYEDSWPASVGAFLTRNVFRGYDIRLPDIIVKAGQAKVFEVILRIESSVGDGSISVDFSTGEFQVMSPMLSIAITSLV